MIEIFIPGNVPSSKNSKQWTGKFLVNSKTTQRYIKETNDIYKTSSSLFKKRAQNMKKPYHIEFTFFRGTKHKFDYINPMQTVQDLMVQYGWLEDDNADELFPILKPYEYSKERPGVLIKI